MLLEYTVSSFWNVSIQDMVESQDKPEKLSMPHPVPLGHGFWTEKINITKAQRFFLKLFFSGCSRQILIKEAVSSSIVYMNTGGAGNDKLAKLLLSLIEMEAR